MSSRRWRISVYLLVALVSTALVIKSRTVPKRSSTAFLRYTTGALFVKLKGNDGFEGIHRIIDRENSVSANKMTMAGVPYYLESGTAAISQPVNGDVLTLSGTALRPTAARMSAVELILVGIPLDPALLSFEDWSALPGIGASLATEIMRYSQKNGGIASIEELIVLPGVGEGTLRRIRPLFRK